MNRQSKARIGIAFAAALGVAAGLLPPASAEASDLKDFLKQLVKKKDKKPPPAQSLVQADSPPDEQGEVSAGLSLDDAVHQVRRMHPKAEVVGAQTRTEDDGRLVHEVKILRQSGQVKIYRFDAASGAILD